MTTDMNSGSVVLPTAKLDFREKTSRAQNMILDPQAIPTDPGLDGGIEAMIACATTPNTAATPTISAAAAPSALLPGGVQPAAQLPPTPNCKVLFDLGPNAGRITAYYHRVIETEKLLVLIYDERFRYGTRFDPPIREEPIIVQLRDRPAINVLSGLGIEFPLADEHLHITVLLCVPPSADNDEEEPMENLPTWGGDSELDLTGVGLIQV